MKDYVSRMVAEHTQLVERIGKLDAFVYSDESNTVADPEFANLCVQLRGMQMYEEALRARLLNRGVVYESGEYFEHIPVKAPLKTTTCPCQDKEKEDDKKAED